MSVGLGLLHCILSQRISLIDLTAGGFDPSFFVGEEKRVWSVVEAHLTRYGTLPSLPTVEADLENFSFQTFPAEPVQYWLDLMRLRQTEKALQIGVQAVMANLKAGDVTSAASELKQAYLNTLKTQDGEEVAHLADLVDPVLTLHDERQCRPSLSGIRFGFPTLDEQSDGAQSGDTIAVVGRPSRGKTYFLCQMSLSAFNAGRSVLFATYEMSLVQVARRLVALDSRISSTLLRLGQLSHFARSRLDQERNKIKGGAAFMLVKGSFRSTVEDLHLLVQQVTPDVLYVDGAYLLRVRQKADNRSDRITLAAEGLKTLAQTLEIPIIASYQFNRSGGKKGGGGIEHIYMSDAIGQLASIVLGIEEGEKRDAAQFGWTGQQIKVLRILKGREGERGEIPVLFDLDHMRIEEIISEREEWEDDELVDNQYEVEEGTDA
jgi:replicative DNA helicase